MCTLYFVKPKNAVLRLNGALIYSFPHTISYSEPIIMEYLPYTNDFQGYCDILTIKNGKLHSSTKTEITVFDSENIQIGYLPIVNNPYNLELVNKIKCELPLGTLAVSLIHDNLYHLISYLDGKLENIVNLPSDIRYPSFNETSEYLVVNAKTIFEKRYICVLEKANLKVLINEIADEITCDENGIILKTQYKDSLERTKNALYSFSNNLALTQIDFNYKPTLSTKIDDIPTLFLEAYIAKDIPKIDDYTIDQINYNDLAEYLGDFRLEPKLVPTEKDCVLISYADKNIRIVKTVKFKIENGKIATFELT